MQIKPLTVYKQGRGQSVVFIHGFVSTHRYWNDVVSVLPSKEVCSTRIDLLGFGNSPRPKKAKYTANQQVKCIDYSLKQKRVNKPFILVGHSAGAIIAMKYAKEHPRQVSQLVLTGVPLITKDKIEYQTVSLANRPGLLKNQFIFKAVFYGMHVVSYVPRWFVRAVVRNIPKHIAEDATSHSPIAYRKSLQNIIYKDEVLDLIRGIKIPAKIIVGKKDYLTSDAKSLSSVCRRNNKVDIIETETDHHIPIKQSKLVADIIIDIVRIVRKNNHKKLRSK